MTRPTETYELDAVHVRETGAALVVEIDGVSDEVALPRTVVGTTKCVPGKREVIAVPIGFAAHLGLAPSPAAARTETALRKSNWLNNAVSEGT